MKIENLISKYINSTEKALKEIRRKKEVNITNKDIDNIIKYAKDYLKDAKYYRDQKKLDTSLTSIAYCEGLLDALRLIGVVNFDWIKKEENKK
jgi:FAD synthetase